MRKASKEYKQPKSSVISEEDQNLLYEIIGRTAGRNITASGRYMTCPEAARHIKNYLEKVQYALEEYESDD